MEKPPATAEKVSYSHMFYLFFSIMITPYVECKSEGHMKYHLAHSTSITEPFEGQFDIESSPFHGRFHVFKHSKADEMKAFIAEVNVTSPERILYGHFLLCYCCLLLFQQSRCQIHLICRYCLESHRFL